MKMNENGEERRTAPLIHGRMLYCCENCGQSWFMYLEKGIEEFGENHKPSPFTIVCPYCGGWASDVSGIQKVPGGRYVKLPGEYMYFANLEDRDCGVPMLYEVGIARSGAKILIADELGAINGDPHSRQIMDELLENMRKRTEEYIEAVATQELLADTEAEAQGLLEAARILAEQSTYSLEEAMGAILNALGGYTKTGETRRELDRLDLAAIRDRKEAREKRRTVERATASRFRRYKARETGWTARKRTSRHQREWRGPWREAKRTN